MKQHVIVSETKPNHILFKSCKQQNIVAFLMVTNYKLGQFKLDYEEYQKLKVMFQFINPDFSFININVLFLILWLYEANEGTFCPKYSVRASDVCSSTTINLLSQFKTNNNTNLRQIVYKSYRI